MNKTMLKPGFQITIMLFFFLCFSAGFIYGQDKGTFTDKRDGHTYRWAAFGKQVWLLGNLGYKTPTGSWVYNNDTTKEAAYGRLYDWTTAQKACPKGWHMPKDGEWNTLITILGGEDVAGGKLQEADSIPAAIRPAKEGDLDNFTALLAGMRHMDSSYTGFGMWGGCWSATAPTDIATVFLFTRHGKPIGKSSNDKTSAFSVKCVRNK